MTHTSTRHSRVTCRHGRAGPVSPGATGLAYAVPLPSTPLLAGARRASTGRTPTPSRSRARRPVTIRRSGPTRSSGRRHPRSGSSSAGARRWSALVGIERGGRHVFDTVSWSPHEVLLGVDQEHLGFRASVLVEAERVVVSTIVEVRNRRGRAYSALVRRVHPLVVRTLLSTRGADVATS